MDRVTEGPGEKPRPFLGVVNGITFCFDVERERFFLVMILWVGVGEFFLVIIVTLKYVSDHAFLGSFDVAQ